MEAAGLNLLEVNYHDYVTEDGVKVSDITELINKRLLETAGQAFPDARGIFTRLLRDV
jgi:hypothetical protein